MRKRVFSTLLVFVMTLGMFLPAMPSVCAVSEMTTSEDAIALIKEWEGFSPTAFWDVSQWTVGYGTAGVKGQTMTPEQADAAMREHLARIDRALNEFAASKGITLSQHQHDALASFSFNCGTLWLRSSGRLLSAVVNGGSDPNAFLFAISLWSNVAGETDIGVLRRRLSEANVYLNHVYAKSVPAEFSYVLFDAGGGTHGHGGEDKMQGYINTADAPILAADPTRTGYTFGGWFNGSGQQITALNASTRSSVLYARWIGADGTAVEPEPAELPAVTADAKPLTTGTVQCDTYVNLRRGPGTSNAVIGKVTAGQTLNIYEMQTVADRQWGRTEEGWICLQYVALAGTTPAEETAPAEPADNAPEMPSEPEEKPEPAKPQSGTVNADGLNVRKAPGTANEKISRLNRGTKVTVYETVTTDNAPWGRIDGGWVCMYYIDLKSDTPAALETPVSTGTVSSNTQLNVRSGPGTANSRVSGLNPGTKVSIYETVTAQGLTWGRIDGGWICLQYVALSQPVREDSAPAEEPAQTPPAESKPAEKEPSEEKPAQSVQTDGAGNLLGVVSSGTALNVRCGAGTAFPMVGMLNPGTEVTIYEQSGADGLRWGRIGPSRWICMSYVALGAKAPVEQESQETPKAEGKVVSATNLNIRSGPGVEYPLTGKLAPGSAVKIIDVKTVGATTWGRTATGWISMDFVAIESGSLG